MTLADSTVAIVGLGLLGGSLGLALAGRCARRIGVVENPDAHPSHLALDNGAVDALESLEAAASVADLVVLATPVRAILELIPRVAQLVQPGAVVTDVGSTKSVVVAAMRAAAGAGSFAGGHPMCGGTAHGVEHASAALFGGATWAICSAQSADDAAVERVTELATAVGAEPLRIDADEHDRAVALTSHLPYVVAQALVHAAAQREQEQPGVDQLAAGGWARATASAAGDVTMWRDVLATNSAPIVEVIDLLRGELGELATQLREHPTGLEAWLEQGARRRRGAGPAR